MNIKYIIFYNHFHNGDIHVSREFVKQILRLFSSATACYFHNNSPRLTLDLCPSSRNPEWFDKTRGFYFENDTLYINTWYAANKSKYYHNCTISTLHALFKHELLGLGLDIVGANQLNYMPSYDWSKYKIDKIQKYFEWQVKPSVLFCNNSTWSGQSTNFDMTPILDSLAQEFPEVNFIVTNPTVKSYVLPNIINAEDIIGFANENLPEISFLSTFCDLIIGRGSGPYSFAFNKENILEKPKRFVGICSPETYNFGLSELLEKDIFTRLDYNDKLLSNLSREIQNAMEIKS